jgi:hypothetical protein
MSVRAAAFEYHRRGWAVVPIVAGSKAPKGRGWDKRAFRTEELGRAFGASDNIGVILGRRSAGLVDIDLDCAEALALADLYLPQTLAVFGRASKPRSHRLYQALGTSYEAFADPVAGDVLLELRAEGKDGGAHQTVVPPSLHPSGEAVAWAGEVVVPAAIDAARLRRRAEYLATACLVARYISETAARRPGPDLPLLLWEADRQLGEAAFRWLDEPFPDAPREYPRPRPQLTPAELDLIEVVRAIPNDCSWPEWNAIGMAIYTEDPTEHGRIVFDAFSAKSPKYDPRSVAERWRNYRRSPPNRTGAGKLIALARKAGWRPRHERDA